MSRVLEIDACHRRVWIGGQRCHHGATGIFVTMTACGGLVAAMVKSSSITRPVVSQRPSPLLALALAGGALMAHDWKDRSIWFERGRGSQR
jgi:hypothetical protein